MSSVIPVRTAEKMLRDAGFEFVRMSKHAIWKHPDGRTLSLPRSPQKGELRGYMAQKVRTYARGDRLTHQRVDSQYEVKVPDQIRRDELNAH